MIRSFKSETAKELFDARWGGYVRPVGEHLLENCFMDLRLIEVARLNTDLLNSFRDRITNHSESGESKFVVISPASESNVWYEIRFNFENSEVENLDIILGSDSD